MARRGVHPFDEGRYRLRLVWQDETGQRRDSRKVIEAQDEADAARQRLEILRKLRGTPLPRRVAGKGLVYFVQAQPDGAIKIGWTMQTIERRLAALQAASPLELVVLGTRPGGPGEERALHARFRADRLHHEWFAPTPELIAEATR